MASRMATYFVPGAGIDREVITTDICRYLGPDALVKPGIYQDPKRGPTAQPESGFFVTAYRSLTTDQLTDIKADSARWVAERTRNSQINRQNGGDGYRASATRARQQDQPSPYSPNAAPSYGQQPMPQSSIPPQYDQYGRIIPQPQSQYGQSSYPQNPSYTYGQTVGYGIQNPQQQGRPMAPQSYQQAPAASYPPQGRGMDTGYGSIPDSRNQYDSGAYGAPLGRSQPMAPQQQYATSGGQSMYPDAYQRGQQDDTAMGDYDDYEDQTYKAPALAPAPVPPTQPSRQRERDTHGRDRDRDEPRRSEKHRRR